MQIKGFIETSFVDWDGKISSVIFLGGCNLACPFCQNYPLNIYTERLPSIPIDKIELYLREYRDWIDGVVISGGEPTIHEELPILCRYFKELGFEVKVDTNGTNPSMLERLIKDRLVDYIAMDVKAPLEESSYRRLVDKEIDIEIIKESVELLKQVGIDYEFRTTVVSNLLDEEAIEKIGHVLRGAKKYVLQEFVPENAYAEELKTSYRKIDLDSLAQRLSLYLPTTFRSRPPSPLL